LAGKGGGVPWDGEGGLSDPEGRGLFCYLGGSTGKEKEWQGEEERSCFRKSHSLSPLVLCSKENIKKYLKKQCESKIYEILFAIRWIVIWDGNDAHARIEENEVAIYR